jgi:hypothetical protein
MEALIDGEGDPSPVKQIELAKVGDLQASRLCLERILRRARIGRDLHAADHYICKERPFGVVRAPDRGFHQRTDAIGSRRSRQIGRWLRESDRNQRIGRTLGAAGKDDGDDMGEPVACVSRPGRGQPATAAIVLTFPNATTLPRRIVRDP